mmetsp:Transcript_40582/g.128567  ORF Transcript_40582/g.128567 Transcript_40582/m.128567 type:complete len:205 (+) Transcript_40582:31-645(+)
MPARHANRFFLCPESHAGTSRHRAPEHACAADIGQRKAKLQRGLGLGTRGWALLFRSLRRRHPGGHPPSPPLVRLGLDRRRTRRGQDAHRRTLHVFRLPGSWHRLRSLLRPVFRRQERRCRVPHHPGRERCHLRDHLRPAAGDLEADRADHGLHLAAVQDHRTHGRRLPVGAGLGRHLHRSLHDHHRCDRLLCIHPALFSLHPG